MPSPARIGLDAHGGGRGRRGQRALRAQVRRPRLWPRSFSLMIEQPPTQADKRAFRQRGKVEERRQDETVSIDFPASEQTDATRTDAGSSDAD